MTEEEWFSCCSLQPMAEHLRFPHASERKRWLFACACCRRIWSHMKDERSRQLIEARERYAMGQVSESQLWQAIEAASHAREDAKAAFRNTTQNIDRQPETAPAWAAAAASTNAATAIHFSLNVAGCVSLQGWERGVAQEQAEQCVLLRDVFGNPFRGVGLESEWRTSDVLALAVGIYDEYAFDRMPILADALQDAGCDNADILDHCRGPGQHVRGCWVVDLILGKE